MAVASARWNSWWALAVLSAGLAVSLRASSAWVATAAPAAARGAWPPGPFLAANAGRTLESLLLAAALLLACDALGARLLVWLGGRRTRARYRGVAVFAGHAAIAAALLGLAAASLWVPAVLLAAGFALAALAVPTVRTVVDRGGRAVVREWRRLPAIGRAAAVLLPAWWIVRAGIPDLHLDAMGYHLAFPQQLFALHRLPGPGAYVGWTYPLPAELTHAWAILSGCDPAAVMSGLGLAAWGAVALLKAMPGRPSPGDLALAAIASLWIPAGRSVLDMAKSDAPACGYLLAACAVLVARPVRTRPVFPGRSVLLAALLAGGAVAVKYVLAPAGLALAAFAAVGGCGRRTVILAAGGLALPLLPWAVKGVLLHGDPLYPAGSLVAGWAGLAAPRLLDWEAGSRALWPEVARLAAAIPRDALLLVASLPWLLAGPRPLKLLAGALAVAWGGMALTSAAASGQAERYVFPCLAAWNLAGACLLLGSTRRRGARVLLAALAVAAQALPPPPARWPDPERPDRAAAYLAGKLSSSGFREQGLGAYGELLPVLRRTLAAGGARGAVLAESAEFWDIPRRVLAHGIEPPFAWTAARETADAVRTRVRYRQAGVRWVLYDPEQAAARALSGMAFPWTPSALRRHAAFAGAHLTCLAAVPCRAPGYGAVELYAVDAPASPASPAPTWLPGAEHAWSPALAALARGEPDRAVRELAALRRLLPGVPSLAALLGHALVQSGREREALPFLAEAAAAGVAGCYAPALVNLAIAEGRLGRREAAARATARAVAVHARWPGLARDLRALARPRRTMPE